MARILIVDDEQPVRALVREMLALDRHDILEAADGAEARALYEEQEVDLVITDLVMPDKSGIDLIMELRERDPDVRILAISGGGGITGRFDYLPIAELIGARSILRKPFQMGDLRAKVSELLDS